MLILGLYLVLLILQNIYTKSNKSSSISTFNESVNMVINGVKLENIITIPKEVHICDIFEVNATVVNTLPLKVTIIIGNVIMTFLRTSIII
jgi:hypothetical protein